MDRTPAQLVNGKHLGMGELVLNSKPCGRTHTVRHVLLGARGMSTVATVMDAVRIIALRQGSSPPYRGILGSA